jgi:hypothetical protein
MGRRPRQRLLVAAGEDAVLSPEVEARAAEGMGTLILQILRVESAKGPDDEEQRKGNRDDPRF